jgi:hypothetical protein
LSKMPFAAMPLTERHILDWKAGLGSSGLDCQTVAVFEARASVSKF